MPSRSEEIALSVTGTRIGSSALLGNLVWMVGRLRGMKITSEPNFGMVMRDEWSGGVKLCRFGKAESAWDWGSGVCSLCVWGMLRAPGFGGNAQTYRVR